MWVKGWSLVLETRLWQFESTHSEQSYKADWNSYFKIMLWVPCVIGSNPIYLVFNRVVAQVVEQRKKFRNYTVSLILIALNFSSRQSSWQRRQAHNLEVEGSSPAISLNPNKGERCNSIGRAGKIRTKQEIYGYFGLENPGLQVRILSAPILWSCGEMVNTGKRTVFNILVLLYILPQLNWYNTWF